MPDTELANITEDTTPDATDLLYVVNAAGTTDKRTTVGDMATAMAAFAAPNTAKVTRQSTTFSVPNNAFTPITWDTEVWDQGGMVDLGTQATRVTVAADGKYRINGGCIIVANATGVRILAVKKNGTTYLAEQMLPASSAIDQGMSIAVDDTAVAGDYYQIEVYQNSGAARNLSASVYNRCSVTRFST